MSLADVMGHAGLSAYAVAGLVLFLAAFVAIVVRTFWPGRGRELDHAARLPLDDDHPDATRPGANE